jgi:hypothetical protein
MIGGPVARQTAGTSVPRYWQRRAEDEDLYFTPPPKQSSLKDVLDPKMTGNAQNWVERAGPVIIDQGCIGLRNLAARPRLHTSCRPCLRRSG